MKIITRKVWLTRRDFLGRVCVIAGAAPALYALPAAAIGRGALEAQSADLAARSAPVSPIVSFHMGQPYLDKSGTAVPYVPPAGARSGQAASGLSDVEYLSRYPYF